MSLGEVADGDPSLRRIVISSWLLLMVVLSCWSVCAGQHYPTTTKSPPHQPPPHQPSGGYIQRLLYKQEQTHAVLEKTYELTLYLYKPRDCYDIYKSGKYSDGIYTIYIGCSYRPVQVYCDMTTDGGGWTVFQRRKNGEEDFYRTWNDYKAGFGQLGTEFWLGNDNLHLMTSDKRHQLRVDMYDWARHSAYAKYDDFQVDSYRDKYRLYSLGKYSGNAGDSMSAQLGHKFSTKDQDNDVHRSSCAQSYKGGWWYGNCHRANLNGLYLTAHHDSFANGVNWYHWKGYNYSLKYTEMKIKPAYLY